MNQELAKEKEKEHEWKSAGNFVYCKVCKMLMGSSSDKDSKCSGVGRFG